MWGIFGSAVRILALLNADKPFFFFKWLYVLNRWSNLFVVHFAVDIHIQLRLKVNSEGFITIDFLLFVARLC